MAVAISLFADRYFIFDEGILIDFFVVLDFLLDLIEEVGVDNPLVA